MRYAKFTAPRIREDGTITVQLTVCEEVETGKDADGKPILEERVISRDTKRFRNEGEIKVKDLESQARELAGKNDSVLEKLQPLIDKRIMPQ